MSHEQRQLTHSAKTYRCLTCARSFVAFDEDRSGAPLCGCGAPLVAGAVGRGLHEILTRTPRDGAVADAEPTAPGPAAPAEAEADVGYGASHGYEQAHGGPSGPGDAPADADGPFRPDP
jgi:hypothetical protein